MRTLLLPNEIQTNVTPVQSPAGAKNMEKGKGCCLRKIYEYGFTHVLTARYGTSNEKSVKIEIYEMGDGAAA